MDSGQSALTNGKNDQPYYVIDGELELTIESTTYQLKAGYSFFFKNHLTNRYRNAGKVLARVVWVNTPQIH
jgi:glyoxylate utilization-related uncharacterized protein